MPWKRATHGSIRAKAERAIRDSLRPLANDDSGEGIGFLLSFLVLVIMLGFAIGFTAHWLIAR